MPSWRVHRSVTEAALAELGAQLPREVVRGLLEGVTDPDRAPDRRVLLRVTRRGKLKTRVRYVAHHDPSPTLVGYYFDLSLYRLRRGDGFGAGLMLGRALHYIQDGALSRRRYLVLDVHDAEEEEMGRLATTPRGVRDLCKGLDLGGKRRSSRAAEALCIALRESAGLLRRFAEEAGRPVDAAALRRRVRRVRLAKALAALASAAAAALHLELLAVAVLVTAAAALYRPRVYYEAMRAGLMVVKPIGIRTAY